MLCRAVGSLRRADGDKKLMGRNKKVQERD